MKIWLACLSAILAAVVIVLVVSVPPVQTAAYEEDLATQVSIGYSNLQAHIETAETLALYTGDADDTVQTLIKKARRELERANEHSVAAHKKERPQSERVTSLRKALAHFHLGNVDVSLAMDFLRENLQKKEKDSRP